MFRKLAMAAAVVCATVLLSGASCGGPSSGSSSESGSALNGGATAATSISYETFLAVLAENGWVPNEDQKFIGGVDKGVEVTVLHCGIRLILIDPAKLDYRVNSVNGFDPGYFGDESEALLGPANMTRSEFEANLKKLTDKGSISPC